MCASKTNKKHIPTYNHKFWVAAGEMNVEDTNEIYTRYPMQRCRRTLTVTMKRIASPAGYKYISSMQERRGSCMVIQMKSPY